jgi:hypothetical protein
MQKLLLGSFSVLHWGQIRWIFVPQAAQNLALSIFSNWHFWHSICSPSVSVTPNWKENDESLGEGGSSGHVSRNQEKNY